MMPSMAFVDPRQVIGALPERPKGTIADFGCGAGYFSVEFAKAVGDEGNVIALDVLPSALDAVEGRIKTEGLRNITTKRVNLERANGSGLGPSSVDWVILKDVLFQNAKKEILVGEIFRVLRPGGHAIIMEWAPVSGGGIGPDQELRVPPEALKDLLRKAGFSDVRDLQVGAFHYGFLVTK
ncbi:MAG: methyltransferase domain-containing protein [Candidatus Moranbacteria bacterium]|nr:methyltransferase domain-containing protein [Candidatus Moranbacteria bacterium]NTW45948.1 methyltransferase domain-containing protein [Candidatus Moranbacteria bacterium]